MLFVGDDWAEDHHDVYLMDDGGARVAARRLPEGVASIAALHELIAAHAEEPGDVVVGIETDRGLWVNAFRCSLSIRWRWPVIATGIGSRERNPMPPMPSCWLI